MIEITEIDVPEGFNWDMKSTTSGHYHSITLSAEAEIQL